MPHYSEVTGIPHVPAFSTDPKEIVQLTRDNGAIILEGFFSKEHVARINADLEKPLSKIQTGSSHNAEHIRKFHGAQTKRLTNVVTHSQIFREEIFDHDYIHQILVEMFHRESGSYWMAAHQVIQIGPGNGPQPLHRDQGQYQLPNLLGPDGPQSIVNFLCALTDCTERNGATRVIPGSHKWPDFTNVGSPDDTIAAELNAGDILVFTGKLVHGGGANLTRDEQRRVLSWAFTPSYLTPEEAYPFIVPIDLVRGMSPRAQRMLGFRSQYPKNSPGLWQSDYCELAPVLGLEGIDHDIEAVKASGRR